MRWSPSLQVQISSLLSRSPRVTVRSLVSISTADSRACDVKLESPPLRFGGAFKVRREITNQQHVVSKAEDDNPVGMLTPCYPAEPYDAATEARLKSEGYVHPLVTPGSLFYCEVSSCTGVDGQIGKGTVRKASEQERTRRRSRLCHFTPTEWDKKEAEREMAAKEAAKFKPNLKRKSK